MDEEIQWALRVQSGDDSAFQLILNRYEKPLLNFFFRFFGNRETAEDATQQLFLQFYRSIPRYRPTAKLNTYLYSMARNLAINISRRNALLNFFGITEETEFSLPPAPRSEQPEASFEQKQKMEEVQRALSLLPPRQRIAVILAYFDDCSSEEIAERTGNSVGAVESMLFRARQTLKKSLKLSIVIIAILIQTLNFPSKSSASESPENSFALLVLPSTTTFSTAENSWIEILEKVPELRLTVALSAEDLALLMPLQKRLIELRNKGKLEIALRLNGDPPLPLIYDLDLAKMFLQGDLTLPPAKISWPEDVTGRIVRGKLAYKSFFSDVPRGFVPGGGSLNLPIAEFLKKQQFLWAVGGFPESEWGPGTVLTMRTAFEDPFLVFSAHPFSNGFHFKSMGEKMAVQDLLNHLSENPSSIPAIVLDASHCAFSIDRFLTVLGEHLAQDKKFKMALYSEAREAMEKQASTSLQIWPYSWPWLKVQGSPRGPGLTTWIGDKKKNEAWELLAQARSEAERYKNSGNADLDKLDRIMDSIYLAESASFFEFFGTEADPSEAQKPELENTFKEKLGQVYQQLNLPKPSALKKFSVPSLIQKKPVATETAAISTETQFEENSVQTSTVAAEPKDNPEKSTALYWIQDSDDRGEEMKGPALKRFSVSVAGVNDNMIRFQFAVKDKSNSVPVIQLYIDINHRKGAGSTDLAGSNVGLSSEDGWEFLLSSHKTVEGWKSRLLQANGAAPVYATSPAIKLSDVSKSGETVYEVQIPKKFLGDHPSRWGYLPCLLLDERGPILDFLAPVEDKSALLMRLNGPQNAAGGEVILRMGRNHFN